MFTDRHDLDVLTLLVAHGTLTFSFTASSAAETHISVDERKEIS